MKWTSPSPKTLLCTLLQPLVAATNPPQVLPYAPIFELLTGHKIPNSLNLGRQAHAHMLLRGLRPTAFVGAKMVAMYASSGDLNSAALTFAHITRPSSLLCNSIIRAYTVCGNFEKTIEIYFRMHLIGLKADYFTYPFVLKSCADLSRVGFGRCVHGQGLRGGWGFDMYIGTSLIDFYVKCGELSDGRRVFDEMPVRDVSSWNALIAGYMRDGMISYAEDLFGGMEERNVVSWTAMISGYTQNGLGGRALCLFNEMLEEGSEVKPNWLTVMSVLPACAQSADLEQGRRIHKFASGVGLDSNPSVKTALAAMYAKCGSFSDARFLFMSIPANKKGLVAWNTMITAYASHGYGMEAVSTFEDMIRAGVQPDEISFTGLFCGCSHSGLVDIGLKYFNCMTAVYSVEPRRENYASVVDLLSRAGRLLEAKQLIYQMPMQAGPSIWGALLAGCRKHRNLEIAEIAARNLFVLEPENSGNYVLLSNMYADVGMWEEVDSLRSLLKARGLRKNLGSSWVEINGKTHLFLGGDTSHPDSNKIYLLEAFPEKIKAASY
ncbi:hypothetical protein RHSIM_Rhsim11G0128700 [Rhododendron simsii]|uniref:Pentatricopeptide repeat-containing protein n=1 Tax=Rhododendron simsii TaxID=118357 RepID=A0A834LA27_RHOSS|nr:hypothetical protein RHSIM_Rhsim11G0128700 [Rhododendron simsii]